MKESFFAKNYSACWKFLNECRWHVVFAVGIFALTFLVGFIYPYFFRTEIFAFIANMIEMIDSKGAVELMWIIFFNNMKASFFAIVLGIAFGILPLITVVANGYLLGFVSREAAMQEGLAVMWQLLPHGIFELPAVILSIGIGMKIGLSLFGKKGSLKYNFIEGLRFFVFVIFPLLLIAAIIEGLLIGFLG